MVDLNVSRSVRASFDKFLTSTKDRLKQISDGFESTIQQKWSQVVHITTIVNKWSQRVAESSKVSANLQKVLIAVQIGQTAVAVRQLSVQAAASFALGTPTGIARGIFLSGLAADLTAEMIYLQTQRASAEAASREAEIQGNAVRQWRESYN